MGCGSIPLVVTNNVYQYMASIKRNFLYSSILTTSNIFFAFITYPYVSRVLGVANIGLCNWVDSIINYFLLFSMMGIVVVGNREIAACQKDKEKLSATFSSLLILNAIFTFFASIILLALIFTVPQFYENRNLLLVGFFKLLTNFLTIEWFYKGLEKFKYVTTCSLVVKILYVISVFSLVKTPDDYQIFYILSALTIILSAVVNILYSNHYSTFSLRNINIKLYIKPFLIFGIYTILTSAYTSLNITYLGFVSGEVEVGYYTTATKLFTIITSLFTALTGVIMPRASALASEGKLDDVTQILQKTIRIVFCLSIPVILVGVICADQIIRIISGLGYEGAIIPMQITMPLIVVIGMEQILIIQGLMPLKKDREVMIGTTAGAIGSLFANVLLINRYASIGAAYVWFLSEIIVFVNAAYFMRKYLSFRIPYNYLFKNIIIYIPLGVIIYIISSSLTNPYFSLCAIGLFTAVYFILCQLFIIKEETLVELIKKVILK